MFEPGARSHSDEQGIEGATQLALEILVVWINGLEVLEWRSQVGFTGTGENGFDDFLSEDELASENTVEGG
ncbi:MAG: hypothetical protein HWD57_13780 [Candidatus Accumulibacter cognatus]|uniref:Uncharacterized protein n=1 Tax=Candidatus Accumulibacter cognatus TaxID=2954383 RepID=A0A7D5SF14_9PROT|nr:MAG: hypothetical protein HWD57_13780 [Candidatus Accumulibacter cognatus]